MSVLLFEYRIRDILRRFKALLVASCILIPCLMLSCVYGHRVPLWWYYRYYAIGALGRPLDRTGDSARAYLRSLPALADGRATRRGGYDAKYRHGPPPLTLRTLA